VLSGKVVDIADPSQLTAVGRCDNASDKFVEANSAMYWRDAFRNGNEDEMILPGFGTFPVSAPLQENDDTITPDRDSENPIRNCRVRSEPDEYILDAAKSLDAVTQQLRPQPAFQAYRSGEASQRHERIMFRVVRQQSREGPVSPVLLRPL